MAQKRNYSVNFNIRALTNSAVSAWSGSIWFFVAFVILIHSIFYVLYHLLSLISVVHRNLSLSLNARVPYSWHWCAWANINISFNCHKNCLSLFDSYTIHIGECLLAHIGRKKIIKQLKKKTAEKYNDEYSQKFTCTYKNEHEHGY